MGRSAVGSKLARRSRSPPFPKDFFPTVKNRKVCQSAFQIKCFTPGCKSDLQAVAGVCTGCNVLRRFWSKGLHLKSRRFKQSDFPRKHCSYSSFPKASALTLKTRCRFVSTTKNRRGLRFGPAICPEKYYQKDTACAICLRAVQDTKSIFQLPCSHVFHFSCIDKWSFFSSKCPLCRKNFYYEFE